MWPATVMANGTMLWASPDFKVIWDTQLRWPWGGVVTTEGQSFNVRL